MAVVPYEDHPRVCGEHPSRIFCELSVSGSSPRMRGTHVLFAVDSLDCGIIPAYAGNTMGAIRCRPLPWDHPRVCGEHSTHTLSCGHNRGSSPRMRGTQILTSCYNAAEGIIPAYAGNTSTPSSLSNHSWDHPRVCGEHRPFLSKLTRALGSSPRMRGTRKHK